METPAIHHVDWGGTGTPIVFLHGGSAHARWWDFVAPRFADTHRVYALDLRGHGDSAWSPEGAYRLEDYAADVERWIAEQLAEPPVLVGHSLGSFIALRHAIDHPRSLAALALVDGRATFGEAGSRYMRLLRMLAPAEYPSLEEAAAHFQLLPRETIASPEVLGHVARESFRRTASGKWSAKFDPATLSSHVPFDFRDRLRELEFPVLLVRGERSPVLSREGAKTLAASCRVGSFVEIAGAFHHVLLDRPEELASAIRSFLDRVTAAVP